MSEIQKTASPGDVELFDVVDESGDPTGEVVDKKTAHAYGVRHRDLHVWITNGSDLLQQQRSWDKSIMPGAWDISAAGHPQAGESYLHAAVRETSEELGLHYPEERFIRVGLFTSKLLLPGWEQPHNVVGDNFVVFAPELRRSDITVQQEEVIGTRWYPINMLESDLASPETANRHAPQSPELYALGITAMRQVAQEA